MSARKFFLVWTLLFGVVGITVPVFLTLSFLVFHRSFGEVEFFLWPSSLMFMALDTPSPATWSTVIAVYAIAIAENFLLYAAVGAVAWPLAYAIQRSRHHRQLT